MERLNERCLLRPRQESNLLPTLDRKENTSRVNPRFIKEKAGDAIARRNPADITNTNNISSYYHYHNSNDSNYRKDKIVGTSSNSKSRTKYINNNSKINGAVIFEDRNRACASSYSSSSISRSRISSSSISKGSISSSSISRSSINSSSISSSSINSSSSSIYSNISSSTPMCSTSLESNKNSYRKLPPNKYHKKSKYRDGWFRDYNNINNTNKDSDRKETKCNTSNNANTNNPNSSNDSNNDGGDEGEGEEEWELKEDEGSPPEGVGGQTVDENESSRAGEIIDENDIIRTGEIIDENEKDIIRTGEIIDENETVDENGVIENNAEKTSKTNFNSVSEKLIDTTDIDTSATFHDIVDTADNLNDDNYFNVENISESGNSPKFNETTEATLSLTPSNIKLGGESLQKITERTEESNEKLISIKEDNNKPDNPTSSPNYDPFVNGNDYLFEKQSHRAGSGETLVLFKNKHADEDEDEDGDNDKLSGETNEITEDEHEQNELKNSSEIEIQEDQGATISTLCITESELGHDLASCSCDMDHEYLDAMHKIEEKIRLRPTCRNIMDYDLFDELAKSPQNMGRDDKRHLKRPGPFLPYIHPNLYSNIPEKTRIPKTVRNLFPYPWGVPTKNRKKLMPTTKYPIPEVTEPYVFMTQNLFKFYESYVTKR